MAFFVADDHRQADCGLLRGIGRQVRIVLAIGGGESAGEGVGNAMKLAADDVQNMVIPGCGHVVLNCKVQFTVTAVEAFLDQQKR